jgi:nucleoid DNA-binding protein
MAIIDAMLETIKRRLVAGDRVHLGDIGIMEVIPSRRGRGRRPARGKSAHRLLVFRPARSLCS